MKKCKHHYEQAKRNIEILDKQYTANNQYDYTILSHEEIYIFCRKCGESKGISDKYKSTASES